MSTTRDGIMIITTWRNERTLPGMMSTQNDTCGELCKSVNMSTKMAAVRAPPFVGW